MALSEIDLDIRGSVTPETHQVLHFPGVIFGKDPTSLQAQLIGVHSQVPLMRQEQLDLYRKLRKGNNHDSDQVVYASVLEQTGVPVEVFRAVYPHIFKPTT